MTKSTTTIVIDAPCETCYATIWDFVRYPEFIDESKKVRVLSSAEHSRRVEFTVKVLKEIKYSLDFTGDPPSEIRWRLHQGFFTKNSGAWRLTALDPGRTAVEYDLDIEFGLMAPSSVIKMLQENNLPKMLQAFKKQIESKRG